MTTRIPPQLDMTPDGGFRRTPTPPIGLRIGAVALLVAVLTGAFALAALAFWLALSLIPVVLVAGLIAWAAFRIQLWRMRRAGRFGRYVYRP